MRNTQSTDGANRRENGISTTRQNAARTRQNAAGRTNGDGDGVSATATEKTRQTGDNRVSVEANSVCHAPYCGYGWYCACEARNV